MKTFCDSSHVQFRRENEHEQNQTIRFQSAKFADNSESGRLSGSLYGWQSSSSLGLLGGELLFALNRAVPAGNGPAPHRRINHKRADNHAHCDLTTGWVKKPCRSLCVTNTAAVCHACVKARGLRLVVCEPRDTKSSESRPKRANDSSNSKFLRGFAVCNRSEPNMQSIQTKQTE